MPNHENFRAASRANYRPHPVASTEQINAGSFQRIADAAETMATNFLRLQRECQDAQERLRQEQTANKHLRAQVAAQKAVATKLRRRLVEARFDGARPPMA